MAHAITIEIRTLGKRAMILLKDRKAAVRAAIDALHEEEDILAADIDTELTEEALSRIDEISSELWELGVFLRNA